MPQERSPKIKHVNSKSGKSGDSDDGNTLSEILSDDTIQTRNAILTAMEAADLKELATSICEFAEEADGHAHDAKASGSMALLSAWSCGVLLNIAKGKSKHGEFEKWRDKNFSSRFGERTAQRYMLLADRFSCVEKLIKWNPSIRQAYIACGILPEPTDSEKPANKDKEAVARVRLMKSVTDVQTRLRRFSTTNLRLDKDTRKQLVAAKSEIDVLFKALIG
jgi:hypothetical protein